MLYNMLQMLVLLLLNSALIEHVQMYKVACPSHGDWNKRALSFCNESVKYLCLYDIINEQHVEGCEGPQLDRTGAKRIISGSFTRGDCSEERFQPFKFWTNGSSDCAITKSLCSEDGQLVYSNGSAMEDRSCRCDHSRSYAFVKTPNNVFYCFPATEDCTCYLKTCHNLFQLSIDYECYFTSTSTVLYWSSSTFEETTVSRTYIEGKRESNENWMNDNEYNNRKNAAIAALFILIAVSVIAYLIRTNKKLSQTICSPLIKDIVNDYQNPDSAVHNLTEPKSRHMVISNRITDQLGLVENDDINYVRIMHLLFRVATPIVRIVFDSEFHPNILQNMLYKNKLKLQKLRETNRINQDQWDILFPNNEKNVSSEQFDLRLMFCLLGVMSDITIGDLRPFPMHMCQNADLSRIKFIKNMITESAMGQLPDEEFILIWTDLTQAILRLATGTVELRNIGPARKHKTQLMERILKLNPLNFEKESLYRLIALEEEYYPEILNQIIKQYCVMRQTSLENLLNDEKHNLFHMRYKSTKCCKCENQINRKLSENVWKQLFDKVGGIKVHATCLSDKTCSEYFVPKQDLSSKHLDILAAVSLILHISSLFEHFCDIMFSSGFHVFLKEQQHTIYHAMTNKKCCRCVENNKTIFKPKMIDTNDWLHLFKKLRLSADHFLKMPSQYYCTQGNCCCKYRSLKDLKHSSIDRSLLHKILKISGPFHYFDCFGEKLLLHGNLDDDRLVKINMEAEKMLDALLNVLWDGKIKYELRQKIFSLYSLQINDERRGVVQKWLLKQLQDKKIGETTVPLTSILVQDKEGWVLKNVPGFSESETSILQKRTFESLNREERNFLRIVHSLERIVCPAVREKFNRKIPPPVLENILANLYHGGDNNQANKEQKEHKPRLKMYLTKTQKDVLYPSSGKKPSSDDFDLKLMIYILEQHREQQAKNGDIVVDNDDLKSDLSTINSIRRNIMQSPTGLLSNTEFQEYWTTLREVAIRLGGDKYQTLCTELEYRAA